MKLRSKKWVSLFASRHLVCLMQRIEASRMRSWTDDMAKTMVMSAVVNSELVAAISISISTEHHPDNGVSMSPIDLAGSLFTLV
jgi:hypothetical protein